MKKTAVNQKKAGLLTFAWIDNPGSVFQAYALKKVFEQNGLDVLVINYQNTIWGGYRLIPGVDTFCKSVKWTPRQIARWLKLSYRNNVKMREYKAFQKKYLKIQHPVTLPKDLGMQLSDTDALIVGSDQIWNYDLPLVDDCYFGCFPNAPSKKYAYAASFGKDKIDEDKAAHVSGLLNDFRMISVREKSGQAIAGKLTNKSVSSLIDPTLLLTSDAWQDMEIVPRESGYIFVYLREQSEQISSVAKKIAAKQGLQIVSVLRGKLVGHEEKIIGPREWLGYIHHADMVFTNSFHGICFSVIFHKNFHVFSLEKDEWRKSSNTRLNSILELLGLQSTLVRIDDTVNNIPELTEISYDEADRILDQERSKAISYIKEIVEDIYG